MGNTHNFDQLMLADNGLTVEEQQFRDTHNRICYNAQKAAEHWVEMAIAIKEMRDKKLYKAAGFETFGEYTEGALGIKERQAYNYTSILEKLPQGFVQSHAAAGVTKLALLTSVNETEREEILEKIDIDEAPVREVSDAVKEAIEARNKAEEQLSLVIEEKKEAEKTAKNCNKEYLKLAADNADLKRKLKEAESIEPTVVYQADEKQAEEIARQEKEIGELKAREAARESETAALKRRLAEIEQAKVEQPKTEIKGSALVIFKVKFESFQDILDDMNALLEEMSEEQKANCRKAVKVTFEESWN